MAEPLSYAGSTWRYWTSAERKIEPRPLLTGPRPALGSSEALEKKRREGPEPLAGPCPRVVHTLVRSLGVVEDLKPLCRHSCPRVDGDLRLAL